MRGQERGKTKQIFIIINPEGSSRDQAPTMMAVCQQQVNPKRLTVITYMVFQWDFK